MSNIEVKLRRGTTAQHSTFTGAEGEVTVDTDKDTVVVHDGTTVGGHELRKKSDTIAGSEIDNDAIDTAQIAANAVTSTEIAAGAVTSDKISTTDTTFNINDSNATVGIGALANTSDKLLISSSDSALTVATIENTNTTGAPLSVLRLKARGNATMQLWDTNPSPGTVGVFNVESANGTFVITADPAGTPVTVLVGKANGTLNLPNLPTSSVGLSSGDVWNNSGVLNIV